MVVNNAMAGYSRIVELEAWSSGSNPTPTPTPTPTSTPTPNSTPTPTPPVSPTPTPSERINVALTSNGGTASASSELSSPSVAIDGVRNWATTGAWKDATPDAFPDWLQVNFNGSKTINEIDVFAVRDDYTNATDPTEETTFTLYGITDYNVQYWNGANWATVTGGNVTGNNKVWKKITFAPITTTQIRVTVNNGQAGYSRIVELEAWSGTSSDVPVPSNDNTLSGNIDYLNSNPAAILCDFNELNLGATFTSITCQHAKFSAQFPGLLRIANEVGGGVFYRNYLQTTYPAYNFGNVIVEFSQPARNLSFSAVGVNDGTFKVDIYQNNTLSQIITLNARCGYSSVCFMDLRAFNNVTAIVIHTINDPAGLGFDDFNFDVGSPPTPTPTPNRTPYGNLDGINPEGIVDGWAKDPDTTSSINVHFYMSDANGNGRKFIGSTPANTSRPDVGGNYGFRGWRIPDNAPDGTPVRDGLPHRLFVYGINVPSSSDNPQLPPSAGVPFTLQPSFSITMTNPRVGGDLSNTTQPALLGGDIVLNASSSSTGGAYQWSFTGPSVFVGGDPNSSTITIRSIDTANIVATVKYTLNGISSSRSFTINVVEPTVNSYSAERIEQLLVPKDTCGQFLEIPEVTYTFSLGCLNFEPGILINASVQIPANTYLTDPGISGIKYVQAVSPYTVAINEDGTWACSTARNSEQDVNSGWVTDAEDPYQSTPEALKYFSQGNSLQIQTDDNPVLGIRGNQRDAFKRDDRFETYLVYFVGSKPGTPRFQKRIGSLSWRWGGILHYRYSERRTAVPYIKSVEYATGRTVINKDAVMSTRGYSSQTAQNVPDTICRNITSRIEGTAFFVTQQYQDFLNRDLSGDELGAGRFQITPCAFDLDCTNNKRAILSRGFFKHPEFVAAHPELDPSLEGTQEYNANFIRWCYFVYLRYSCEPSICDPQTYQNLVNNLDSTNDYVAAVKYFLNLQSYKNRFPV